MKFFFAAQALANASPVGFDPGNSPCDTGITL